MNFERKNLKNGLNFVSNKMVKVVQAFFIKIVAKEKNRNTGLMIQINIVEIVQQNFILNFVEIKNLNSVVVVIGINRVIRVFKAKENGIKVRNEKNKKIVKKHLRNTIFRVEVFILSKINIFIEDFKVVLDSRGLSN